MPCFHPLAAWQSPFVKQNQKAKILFDYRPGYISIALPCGQCIGCRLERSRQWAVRCLLEADLHVHNEFVTLTYEDSHLPEHSSLNHKHIQLFIKTIRKKKKLRYFMSGEYGDKFERPHYHLCLFDFFIEDKIPHPPEMQNSPGEILYDSPALKRIWGKGNVVIGRLTFETAAYTARYIMKKVTGERAAEHYGKRQPEYCQMSRRPGIAGLWFQEYAKDVLKTDKVITRSLTTKCPKYYDRLIDKIDPILLKEVKDKRIKKLSEKDMTLRRLREKEEYRELKIKTLRRGYEKWQYKKLSAYMTGKERRSENRPYATMKPKRTEGYI